MNLGEETLSKLAQDIANYDWEGCYESCFKFLYGLPSRLQLDCTVYLVKRYLPIFEANRPKATWAKLLVNAPEKWLKEKGLKIPTSRSKERPAEAGFITSVDHLLSAYKTQNNRLGTTSACTSAIIAVIGAHMSNVWEADDPEAVMIWKTLSNVDDPDNLTKAAETLSGRTLFDNVASCAVAEREWTVLLRRFREESTYSTPETEELEQAVEIWKEQGMFPIQQ